VERGERVVADPEPLHRARLEVLRDHVVVGNQPAQELDAARVLEVESDALLAEVVAQIGGAHSAAVLVPDARLRPAARLAVHRVLDLHHLRTQMREQLRGERHRLHLLDRQDPDAGEGTLTHRISSLAEGDLGVGHGVGSGAERRS
jgi:hypothetical protein